MQISLADGLKDQIKRIAPYVRVSVIATEYGEAVKVEGKGSKHIATYMARERFLDGDTNTNWARDLPRHGLGYIIPMYENPITSMAL
jgi:hypothetical protein